MDTLLQDLRYGARSIMRSRGVFLLAVASLAIGVAANTTIFSAVDVFLFRPMPYPEPDALVMAFTTNEQRGWTQTSVSLPDFVDWRERSRTVDLAAYQETSFNLSGGDRAERLTGARVAWNFFRVMGTPLADGRGFRADEERRGSDNVVVISETLWERRFGGDGAGLGATLMIDGAPRTVVGVMPADFEFPSRNLDVWVPLGLTGEEPRGNRSHLTVGRLRDEATLETARADLSRVAADLERTHADDTGMGVFVNTLHAQLFDETFWTAALICMVAVGFVLLIACANIANLLLAKAASRDREIAVRTVLGAGRLRILRQLLTESMLLATVGGALGLLLSVWGIRGLIALMPPDFAFIDRIGLDARVLAFTLVLTAAAGLIFGLAPALQSVRPNLNATLREGGARGGTIGRRQGRFRAGLVIAEIGLALVLLISAGLLVRGYASLRSVDLGFRTEDVLTARVALLETEYPDSLRVTAFYDALLQRLRGEPGIRAVGATTILPLLGGSGTYYDVPENRAPSPEQRPVTQFRGITPGYFDALDVRIERGRDFTDRDRIDAAPVMIVNDAFARTAWPGGDPVGRTVELTSAAYQVVGVAADTRDFGGDSEPPPTVFVPALQRGYRNLAMVMHVDGDLADAAAAVRTAVASLDPNLPVYQVQTMREIVALYEGGTRIMVRLLTIFAAIALVLAVLGVYGVMAYNVAQRTREVGIRMALGAGRREIVRLVLRQGATLASIGLGAGILLALAVSGFLAAFLYGVSRFDLFTFAVTTLALAAAALLASYVPARRATRIDPLDALRTE